MSKKILLFSRDPGGANTIIPLVRPLKENGYEIRLFGKDHALDKYSNAGISGLNIMDFVKNIELKSIEEFLVDERPDFILTGTSADDFTEKYIWKAGEKLRIPSFAIFDQWINYGIRFSKYKTTEIEEYNDDRTHPYLPSKILVMDDYAKQEAIEDGLEPSRIIVTGQPYFEDLLKHREKILPETVEKIRRRMGVDGTSFVITFASEPVSKDYDKSNNSENYWGYTERTVIEELFESIKNISSESSKKIYFIIRPHPREDVNRFQDIILLFKEEKISIITDRISNSWDLILASDLICGMSSMFLIESVLLGKPVISVQIGLNKENPFILDRRGILKSILDKKMLLNQLRSIIIENEIPHYNFDVIKTPVDNAIYQMENYLCQY